MNTDDKNRPNILFIMSDDHAAHAMSCYGSKINKTPNLDKIAENGMRFDNCFCTNSICTPSRANILTGQYSHMNGVKTLADGFDGRKSHVAKILKNSGYQTSIVGKWHLGHGGNYDPTGFDYWNIFYDQGEYHNPEMIEMGKNKQYDGYATDLVTDLSLEWLEERDKDKPFFLMCHHKAPHRNWEPDDKHAHMYADIEIPEPITFQDDYSTRSRAAKEAAMRIENDLHFYDLKVEPPANLNEKELKSWKYQRFIKDYLRCVASIDDNVGKLIDYLQKEGIEDNTIVIYTSDQGFFLGDHGWYDKRFMYEESLRMPFLVQYPKKIRKNSVQKNMALNVDFAPTFLEYANLEVPVEMQGNSLMPLFEEEVPVGWQTSMYYRYWEHLSEPHRVGAHFGLRTDRYKLIHYYGEALGSSGAINVSKEPEWELFDLEVDPGELNNIYNNPNNIELTKELKRELYSLKEKVGDFE